MKGLIEEAPEAYKAVEQAVDVMAETGIAAKVARLRPVAIIKG
jgi:tRNA-splicing ligase RtcB (3'-phosphate/5'-hydroxy nucleic acid ligase)